MNYVLVNGNPSQLHSYFSEQFIRKQIQSDGLRPGFAHRHASASEVIFAGLQLLQEREQTYKGRFEELQLS